MSKFFKSLLLLLSAGLFTATGWAAETCLRFDFSRAGKTTNGNDMSVTVTEGATAQAAFDWTADLTESTGNAKRYSNQAETNFFHAATGSFSPVSSGYPMVRCKFTNDTGYYWEMWIPVTLTSDVTFNEILPEIYAANNGAGAQSDEKKFEFSLSVYEGQQTTGTTAERITLLTGDTDSVKDTLYNTARISSEPAVALTAGTYTFVLHLDDKACGGGSFSGIKSLQFYRQETSTRALATSEESWSEQEWGESGTAAAPTTGKVTLTSNVEGGTRLLMDTSVTLDSLTTSGSQPLTIATDGTNKLTAATTTINADTTVEAGAASLDSVTIANGKTLTVKDANTVSSLTTTSGILATSADMTITRDTGFFSGLKVLKVVGGTLTSDVTDSNGNNLTYGRDVIVTGASSNLVINKGDGTGWNSDNNSITLTEGGTLTYNYRDTLKSPFKMSGGTVKFAANCANGSGRALDVYNSNASVNDFTVTALDGATVENPTVSYITALAEESDTSGSRKILLRDGDMIVDVAETAKLHVVAELISVIGNAGGTRGKFVKNGTGVLELAGLANAYETGTNINAGVLILSNQATLGSGTTTIAENAQLVIKQGTNKLSNAITNNGTITADTAMVDLTGANISGNGTYSVTNGATLILKADTENGASVTNGTLKLLLSPEQLATGYTADVAEGTKVTFIKAVAEGYETVEENVTKYELPAKDGLTLTATVGTGDGQVTAWSGVAEAGYVYKNTTLSIHFTADNQTFTFDNTLGVTLTSLTVTAEAGVTGATIALPATEGLVIATATTINADVTATGKGALGAVTVANEKTLTLNGPVATSIAGQGKLIKTGSDEITLDGSITSVLSTYEVNAGKLTISREGAGNGLSYSGTPSYKVAGGAHLVLHGNDLVGWGREKTVTVAEISGVLEKTYNANETFSGRLLLKDGGELRNSAADNYFKVFNSAIIATEAGATAKITGHSVEMHGGTPAIDVGENATLNGEAKINLAVATKKTGAGTWNQTVKISGASELTIEEGTLVLSIGDAFDPSSSATVTVNGTLESAGTGTTFYRTVLGTGKIFVPAGKFLAIGESDRNVTETRSGLSNFAGTLEVAGTFDARSWANRDYVIGACNVKVLEGGRIEKYSTSRAAKLNIASGKTLSGAGTIEIPVTFADDATLDTTAGVLTVSGTVTLPSALTVKITDAQDVNGAVTLLNAANVTNLGGQTVTVMVGKTAGTNRYALVYEDGVLKLTVTERPVTEALTAEVPAGGMTSLSAVLGENALAANATLTIDFGTGGEAGTFTFDTDNTGDASFAQIIVKGTNGGTIDKTGAGTVETATTTIEEGCTVTVPASTAVLGAVAVEANAKIVVADTTTITSATGAGTIETSVYPTTGIANYSLPSSIAGLTDSENWTGTLKLNKDGEITGEAFRLDLLGNVNSTIEIAEGTTLKGYAGLTKASTPYVGWTADADIVINGMLYVNNGFTGVVTAFTGDLSGVGEIKLETVNPTDIVQFSGDLTGFMGTITLNSSTRRILMGAGDDATAQQGKIVITKPVTIATGKTWTATNGVVVTSTGAISGAGTIDSALTLNAGATIVATDSEVVTVSGALTLQNTLTIQLVEALENDETVTVLTANVEATTLPATVTVKVGEDVIDGMFVLGKSVGNTALTLTKVPVSNLTATVPAEGLSYNSVIEGAGELAATVNLTIDFGDGSTAGIFTFDNDAAVSFNSITVTGTNGGMIQKTGTGTVSTATMTIEEGRAAILAGTLTAQRVTIEQDATLVVADVTTVAAVEGAGTVTFKDIDVSAGIPLHRVSSSTQVVLDNVHCYMGDKSTVTCPIEIAEGGFKIRNGWSNTTSIFSGALTGTGTITHIPSGPTNYHLKFTNVSGFAGTVEVSNTNGGVVLGDGTAESGKIVIAGTAKLGDGWTATNGIAVKLPADTTLNLNGQNLTVTELTSAGTITDTAEPTGAITVNGGAVNITGTCSVSVTVDLSMYYSPTTFVLPNDTTFNVINELPVAYLEYDEATKTIRPKMLTTTLSDEMIWLPVGDSITEGEADMGHPERGDANSRGGYRYQLWKLMEDLGQETRSVGFRTGHSGTTEDPATVDWAWNAGLYGGAIKRVNGNHGGQWYNVESALETAGYPDVITVLLGINDLSWSGEQDGYAKIYEDWTAMVEKYATLRPHSKILVSTLLPVVPGNNSAGRFGPFNDLMRADATAKTGAFQYPNVIFTDVCKDAFNNTFDAANFKGDGIHPNETGSIKVATAFHLGMKDVLAAIAADPLTIVHAHNAADGTLTVRLNKAVESVDGLTATITGTNFAGETVNVSLSGGTLDENNKRVITFALGNNLVNGDYTVTVNGAVNGEELVSALTATGATVEILGTGAAQNVKPAFLEGFKHRKTYTLAGTNNNVADAHTVVAGADAEGEISAPVKVGYYMELQRAGQPAQFVWVSMNAFADAEANLGIPTAATGAYKTKVSDLNVFANRGNFTKEVTGGTGVIEFTPWSWTAADQEAGSTYPVEGQPGYYGWNDTLETTAGTLKGCMQIARITDPTITSYNWQTPAAEMLFAYNNFNSDTLTDVGIGSFVTHRNDSGNSNPQILFDWTNFSSTTGYTTYQPNAYTVKKIELWVSDVVPVTEAEIDVGTGDNQYTTWTAAKEALGLEDAMTSVTINFTPAGQIFTFDESVTIDAVTVQGEAGTIAKDGDATVTVATTTVDANVTINAGIANLGAITINAEKMLTVYDNLTADGIGTIANGKNSGTVRIIGGTAETPLHVAMPATVDGTIGKLVVAQDAVVQIDTSVGLKYDITGESVEEGHQKAEVRLAPTTGVGMTAPTQFRNIKLVFPARQMWARINSNINTVYDETVDIVIPSGGEVLMEANPTWNSTLPTGVTVIGTLSGAGTLNTGNGTTSGDYKLQITQHTATEFSGVIKGMIKPIIAGTQPLTLSNSNTYNRGTEILAGATLIITNAGAIGTGAITGAGTLVCNGVLPTTAEQRITNANWRGKVVLQAIPNFTNLDLDEFGNDDSVIELNGIGNGTNQTYMRHTQTIASDVILTGDNWFTDGSYTTTVTFNGDISGDGAFKFKKYNGSSNPAETWIFNGAYNASIVNEDATDRKIVFGSGTAEGGKIVIAKSVTIANGKTWSAVNGVKVTSAGTLSGTGTIGSKLILEAGATIDTTKGCVTANTIEDLPLALAVTLLNDALPIEGHPVTILNTTAFVGNEGYATVSLTVNGTATEDYALYKTAGALELRYAPWKTVTSMTASGDVDSWSEVLASMEANRQRFDTTADPSLVIDFGDGNEPGTFTFDMGEGDELDGNAVFTLGTVTIQGSAGGTVAKTGSANISANATVVNTNVEIAENAMLLGQTTLAANCTLTVNDSNALGEATDFSAGEGSTVKLVNVDKSTLDLGKLTNATGTSNLILNNVKAYIYDCTINTLTLEGDFQMNNGTTNKMKTQCVTVNTLAGAGTFIGHQGSEVYVAVNVKSWEDFTGSIDLSNEKSAGTIFFFGTAPERFTNAASNAYDEDDAQEYFANDYGTLYVTEGDLVTAVGSTWKAPKVNIANGTSLTIQGWFGASESITGLSANTIVGGVKNNEDEVVEAGVLDLRALDDLSGINVTVKAGGRLLVNTGATVPNSIVFEEGAILGVATKHVEDVGNATLTVNVDGTAATVPTIKGYHMDGVTELDNWAKNNETSSEDEFKFNFDPVFDGELCWWAYEFDNEVNTSPESNLGPISTGRDKTRMTFDSRGDSHRVCQGDEYVVTSKVDAPVEKAIRVASSPWRNVDGGYPTAFTAAMYGTLTENRNRIIMGFGSSYNQKYTIALVTGASTDEVRLVLQKGWNENNTDYPEDAVITLATTTVPNAVTENHLFAFSYEQFDSDDDDEELDSTRIIFYVDGEKYQPFTAKAIIPLGNGFQMGSIHGGWHNSLTRMNGDDVDCTMEYLRIYDQILPESVWTAMSNEYSYMSKNGRATRTIVAGADTTWNEGTEWTQVRAVKNGEDYVFDANGHITFDNGTAVEKPDHGENVGTQVVLNVSGENTLYLNEFYSNPIQTQNGEVSKLYYERLEINPVEGGDEDSLTLWAGRNNPNVADENKNSQSAVITVQGYTKINTNVTMAHNVAFLSGPVAVAEGKWLDFDFSGFDVMKVPSMPVTYRLTGFLDEDTRTRVTSTAPADPVNARSIDLGYKTTVNQYTFTVNRYPVKAYFTADDDPMVVAHNNDTAINFNSLYYIWQGNEWGKQMNWEAEAVDPQGNPIVENTLAKFVSLDAETQKEKMVTVTLATNDVDPITLTLEESALTKETTPAGTDGEGNPTEAVVENMLGEQQLIVGNNVIVNYTGDAATLARTLNEASAETTGVIRTAGFTVDTVDGWRANLSVTGGALAGVGKISGKVTFEEGATLDASAATAEACLFAKDADLTNLKAIKVNYDAAAGKTLKVLSLPEGHTAKSLEGCVVTAVDGAGNTVATWTESNNDPTKVALVVVRENGLYVTGRPVVKAGETEVKNNDLTLPLARRAAELSATSVSLTGVVNMKGDPVDASVADAAEVFTNVAFDMTETPDANDAVEAKLKYDFGVSQINVVTIGGTEYVVAELIVSNATELAKNAADYADGVTVDVVVKKGEVTQTLTMTPVADMTGAETMPATVEKAKRYVRFPMPSGNGTFEIKARATKAAQQQ